MNLNLDKLSEQLRAFAAAGIALAERKGRELLLREGRAVLEGHTDKKQLAVDATVTAYRAATAGTPLSLVTFDDELVREAASRAVEFVWGELGELINKYGDAPVLDAEELTGGTVE